jgi:hypothetical protein
MNSKTIAIFTFVAILLSCQSDVIEVNYINIEQDVELSLSQNVNDFGPFAEVIVSTVDSVSCKNSELVIEQKGVNDKTEVFINGLVHNGICVAGNAKPESFVKLGNESVNHPIAFVLKSAIISEGFIEYNDSSIKLNLNLPKGIVVKNSTVQKLQENTVWGTMTSTDANIIKEFDALLLNHKQNAYRPQIGNYGLLKYYNETNIEINDDAIINTKSAARKYYFQYQNWDNFKAGIKAFKGKYPEVGISLRNFENKSLQL